MHQSRPLPLQADPSICVHVADTAPHALFNLDRRNEYDGLEEYLVKVREKGLRKQEQKYEEQHKQQKEAPRLTFNPDIEYHISGWRAFLPGF